jgi:hypothetical protein
VGEGFRHDPYPTEGTRIMSAAVKFSVLQGPHSGASFAFNLSFCIDAVSFTSTCGDVLVLGRSPVTTLSGGSARVIPLSLPLDKEASATHAQIEFDGVLDDVASHQPRLVGVTARLIDLASTNGSRVNSLSAPTVPGSRKGSPAVTVPSDNLTFCPVSVGDVLRVGSSFLSLDDLSVCDDNTNQPLSPQHANTDDTLLEIEDENSVEIQELTAAGAVSREVSEKLEALPTDDSSCFVCGVSLAEMTLLVRELCSDLDKAFVRLYFAMSRHESST